MIRLNFFDRFFGKEREKRKKREKRGRKKENIIKFEELKIWIEEKQKKRKENVYKEVKPLIKKILNLLGEIRKVCKDLEKKEIPDEIPIRAKKVLITSKPLFVKSLMHETELATSEEEGMIDVYVFWEKLNITLDKIGKMLIGKGRYLPIAFPEEIESIGKKANEILKCREKLKKNLTRIKKGDEKLDKIKESYERIFNEIKRIDELNDQKEKLKREIENLFEVKKNLEEKLKKIEKSKEFKEFLVESEKVEKLKEKVEMLESKIGDFLNPLKRPIKKFRKIEEEYGTVHASIDDYVENPVKKFLQDEEGLKNFEEIINDLNSSIFLLKKLKLKPREEKKIKIVLDNFPRIKKIREEYMSIIIEMNKMNEKLNERRKGIVKEREGTLNEIKSIKRKVDYLENELKKVKEEKEELKKRILKEKEIIENEIKLVENKEIFVDLNLDKILDDI